MSVRIVITHEEVAAATVLFKAAGGEINRTVEFPKIQKIGKSYGRLAEGRRVRKNKRRQLYRELESDAIS